MPGAYSSPLLALCSIYLLMSLRNRQKAQPLPGPGEYEMNEVILKRFEQPDETREFELGKLEIVRLGGLTLGRATYQPGWKWSEHVRPMANTSLCEVEHVGLVLSGRAVAAVYDGSVVDLTPGTLFHIPPTPHDSWVVGDEPYVSLHLLGADSYTK